MLPVWQGGLIVLLVFLAGLRFVALEEAGGPKQLRWYWYLGSLVLFLAAPSSKTVTGSLPAAMLPAGWRERGAC
jgi:hypothetical protein